MLALVGCSAHKNSVVLSTQLVRQHLCERSGYGDSLAVVVDEVVGCLRPLQNYVRTAMIVVGDASLVY